MLNIKRSTSCKMEELINKENVIFDILQKFIDANLDFIVVGGYAVSAYKHRFSVDADIVIQSLDLERFEFVLKKHGFKKTIEKELDNLYSSKFIRYENNMASFDLLTDALASRQTDAFFSYKMLFDNSVKKKVIGIQREVIARIPIKEMLIVMKLHSGRLTDFRDIAALAKDSDIKLIKRFLFVGKFDLVYKNLKNLAKTAKDKNFVDSFKGVFMEKRFDIDMKQVEKISRLKE